MVIDFDSLETIKNSSTIGVEGIVVAEKNPMFMIKKEVQALLILSLR